MSSSRHRFAGQRIDSDVKLAELEQVGPSAEKPVVVLQQHPLGSGGEEIRTWTSPGNRVIRRLFKRDENFELELGSGFRYRLPRGGSPVVLWDARHADSECARLLVHEVLPAVFAYRGDFVLHASAVPFADGIVAITGQSGAGKSTLAAFLAGRLSDVFCDDALWIGLPSLQCRASYRGSWLSPESMAALEPSGALQTTKTSAPTSASHGKSFFPNVSKEQDFELPLRALVHIVESDDGEEDLFLCESVAAKESFLLLLAHHMSPHPSETARAVTEGCAQLADQVPALSVKLPDSFAAMPDCARAIRESLQAITEACGGGGKRVDDSP